MYKIVRILVTVSCLMSINTHAAAYLQGELNKMLREAVGDNNFVMAESLLAAGADVNSKNYFNETPLFLAIKKSNLKIVTLLLQNGAHVNIVSDLGQTPLIRGIFAIESGNKETQSMKILAKLLKAGADPNAQETYLMPPLHNFAINRKTKPEFIVFGLLTLLEAGADKYFKDHEELTPSDLARQYGFDEAADLIDYWPGENLQDRILFSVLKGLCSPDEQEKEVAMRDLQYLLNTCPHYIPFFQKFGVLDIAQA